jgi:ATP-dependent DNA helicase PIF1
VIYLFRNDPRDRFKHSQNWCKCVFGSGKSYTIKTYIDYLAQHGVHASVTASTGIAATHIGGMTIHSWAGIGIKDSMTDYEIEALHEKEYIVKRLQKAKVLIIDEISMLPATTLEMINAVCKSIRQVQKPFGGLQVIFVGDFFQLPPIIKKTNTLELFEDSGFTFTSSAWKETKPLTCYLTEQHRQSDKEFTAMLQSIRGGTIDGSVHTMLQSRVFTNRESLPDVTKLYSHNSHVDTVNERELYKISETVKIFEMRTVGKENLIATLIKGCLSPQKLELKIGAKVMFTKNNPDKGFVNGTLGIVTGYKNNVPVVKIGSHMMVEVEPMEWSVMDNGKILATITQIPLRLAWAMTIHKSQGMSLDSALMDLSQVFEYGQGYVALSRVRTLEGLHMLGYNDKSLEVHPRVQEEDVSFKESSDAAEYEFHQIRKEELERIHDKYIASIGGGKGMALEKVLAYKPKKKSATGENFGFKKYSKFAKKKKPEAGTRGEYSYDEEVIY